MIIILRYKNTSNPRGLPGDYPAEMMDVDDSYKLEAGWEKISDADYKLLISSYSEQVKALISASEAEAIAAEKLKLDSTVSEIEALTAKSLEADTMDDRAKLDAIPNILKVLGAMDETLKKLLASR